MSVWQLVDSHTGEMVAWTDDGFFDLATDEGLAGRLEAAIDDGYLEDGCYEWRRGNRKAGEYI